MKSWWVKREKSFLFPHLQFGWWLSISGLRECMPEFSGNKYIMTTIINFVPKDNDDIINKREYVEFQYIEAI